MITSKQGTLIGVAALLAIAATGACGSDDSAPPSTPAAGAPAAGAAAAGAPAAAAGAPAGGSPDATAGAPAGGSDASGGTGGNPTAAAGTGAGGASGGASAGTTSTAGGASAGTGSSAGGAGGATGGGQTFAAVKTLIAASCGTGNCHNSGSKQLDFQGTKDLHGLLTTAIPSTIMNCTGTIPAVPNDATSLLVRITSTTTATTTCMKNGASQNIAKMPDNCSGSKCLTAAQVKVFSDWIAAGAPQ